ncbi:MAG: hypothetical protein V2I51_05560, partial [Anderseniella sp.]|nr:hypothetical protein [Anderseniella sp.]
PPYIPNESKHYETAMLHDPCQSICLLVAVTDWDRHSEDQGSSGSSAAQRSWFGRSDKWSVLGATAVILSANQNRPKLTHY